MVMSDNNEIMHNDIKEDIEENIDKNEEQIESSELPPLGANISDNPEEIRMEVQKSMQEAEGLIAQELGLPEEIDKENEKEKYHSKQEKLIELKSSMSCKKCGCSKHYLIDFHHTNPAEKDFTISENSHAKFETLLKEIEKCIPLCSNCHREFHYLEKEQGITLIEYLNGGME